VAEVAEEAEGNRLFRVLYDGTIYDEHRFCAIGGHSEALVTKMGDGYEADLSLEEAVRLASGAFESLEDRSIPAEEWEGAVLDRTLGRRTFRRLSSEDLVAGSRSKD
jgi:proteasome alpha subunit